MHQLSIADSRSNWYSKSRHRDSRGHSNGSMMDASVSRQSRDHTQQAAHHVFEELRDMILAVTLAPRTALSRSTLQKKFRLSSTPILSLIHISEPTRLGMIS